VSGRRPATLCNGQLMQGMMGLSCVFKAIDARTPREACQILMHVAQP
jgi:hypothetical protein